MFLQDLKLSYFLIMLFLFTIVNENVTIGYKEYSLRGKIPQGLKYEQNNTPKCIRSGETDQE